MTRCGCDPISSKPTSESLHHKYMFQGMVNPVPVGPNPNRNKSKCSTPSFLSTSSASPVSVPQMELPSPHKLSRNPLSHRHPCLLTPCHIRPTWSRFSRHVPVSRILRACWVEQVSQAPAPQVPVPVQTLAPMATVPQSSAAQQPKPPSRGQFFGLDFL